MPPTRGHDLKLYLRSCAPLRLSDAPHTGARLETLTETTIRDTVRMPPTRGHDLKQTNTSCFRKLRDAPHTGARLETIRRIDVNDDCLMPPTRGHDLKPAYVRRTSNGHPMPPTRGHDLKQEGAPAMITDKERCPPHGGTT